MTTWMIGIVKAVIALALAGSVLVQTMIIPTVWVDLEGAPRASRIAFVTILVLGVGAMQVFAFCVWRLLTKVRRGSVFSETSFRYVDVIAWAIGSAAALSLGLGILLVDGEVAPGVVGLLGGAALVLAGMALVVVVMKTLLRQAIARDHEAAVLRSELDEVV